MAKISPSYRTDAEVNFGHLVLLIGISILLGVFASMFFVPIIRMIVQDKVYQSILTGALVSLFAFLLSPIVLKGFFMTKRRPFYFRFTAPSITLPKAGQALVIMLLMLPSASLLGWIMSQIPIPDQLIPIQKAVEAESELLLNEHRPIGILLVTFFLAVAAPFSEEYFFRGGIMGWFIAKTGQTHIWVWVIALLFSLAHFEWNGLIARFLMGAVLGYVALYGGLPMAILTHAFNNLFVYLLNLTFSMQDPFISDCETATGGQLVYLGIVSLMTIASLFYLLDKLKACSKL